jgi:AcrR family transcriptional regulator
MGKIAIPVQARAHATVEKIVDAAAALLDEVGVDGFNTNLLAARAGVRVRSVYRYFPDKLAVIVAVAQRLASRESGHVSAFGAVADRSVSWHEAIDRTLDAYLRGAKAQPGFLAVRHAMAAVPELRAVEREANRRLVALLSRALHARGIGLHAVRRRAVAQVIVETVAAVLDVCLREPPRRAALVVDELRRLLVAYVGAMI